MQYNKILDNKIAYEIVKFHRIDTLKRYFPDTRSMVEFSNYIPPYPERRDSVLALLAYSADLKFVKKFWRTYFFNGADDSIHSLEKDFLNGTDRTGTPVGYKFFRADAPQDVLVKEAEFLGRDSWPAHHIKKRTPAQIDRWQIYAFYKKRFQKCLKSFEWQDLHSEQNWVMLDDELFRKINLADKNASAWLKKAPCFQNIVLMQNSFDENFWIEATQTAKSLSLNKMVYDQATYADNYFWAGDMLRNIDSYALQAKDENKNLHLFFNINNGVFLVLESASSLITSNLKEGKSPAFAIVKKSQIPVVGANTAFYKSKDNIRHITHELSHCVDIFSSQKKDYVYFSDLDVMKFCDMMQYVNRHHYSEFVSKIYKPVSRRSEMIAYYMGDNHSKEFSDSISDTMRKLFYQYAEWRLHHNSEKIEQTKNLISLMLGEKYPQWQKLYAAYDTFVSNAEEQAWNFEKQLKSNPEASNFLTQYVDFFGDNDKKWIKQISQAVDDLINPPKQNSQIQKFGLLLQKIYHNQK